MEITSWVRALRTRLSYWRRVWEAVGDCAKGAVIGAVAGLPIGWYFESKKIASAQTVNKEYVTAKKITLPKKDIVPASFTTNVVPAQADASGQKEVQITSNTDLIGYGDKVPEVQQKYAIYDENNNLGACRT